MLRSKKVVALFSALILSQVSLIAQNNTNSPYTRFGWGQLADPSFGAGKAMGGIGYGLRNNKQVNPLNPASYSNVDSLTFMLDIGVTAQMSRFEQGGTSTKNFNGNLEYIAMQFPIHKKLAVSIGLLPVSFVGYEYGSSEKVDGSDVYATQVFNGTGGLSEVYGGISYKPFKRFSIGANIGYMFGSVTHNQQVAYSSSDAYSTTNIQKVRVSDMKFDLGIQYTQPFGKDKSLTLGAVYSPKMKVNGTSYNYTIVGSSENQGDTIRGQKFDMPNSYGAGFTFVKKDKYMFGADVLYQQWKDTRFFDNSEAFNNRFRVGFGGEYTPDAMARNIFKRMKYRAGAYVNNSYVKIDNSGYDEYGASIGFGIPMLDNRSVVNLVFEYVKIKPEISKLIDEQYFKFTVNYTFNERWFYKQKIK